MSPSGNDSGELFVIEEIPLTSSTVTSPRLTIFPKSPVASDVMSCGTIKVGSVVSVTETN